MTALWPALLAFAAAAQPAASPTPSPQPSPEAAIVARSGSWIESLVRFTPGLVLEREENAGMFPAEPSRFGWRGGSWAHNRLLWDGFDLTDPSSGGRPVAWVPVEEGDLELRGEPTGVVVELRTPARPPDEAEPMRIGGRARLSLFEKTPDRAVAPAIARGEMLAAGRLFIDRPWNRAGQPGFVRATGTFDRATRFDRGSPLDKTNRVAGGSLAASATAGPGRIDVRSTAQWSEAPFGPAWAAGSTTALRGFVGGARWTRPVGAGEARFSASWLSGSSVDATAARSILFDRLLDGPPELVVPRDRASTRTTANAGWTRAFGSRGRADLSASWTRSTLDTSLAGRAPFDALERIDGLAARVWSFTQRAPSKVVSNEFALSRSVAWNWTSLSVEGGVTGRVTRVSTDAVSVLSQASARTFGRVEWRAWGARFSVAASEEDPPLPLVNFEPPAQNAIASSARVWADRPPFGAPSSGELGVEAVRRGTSLVDESLKRPKTRQLTISAGKSFGRFSMLGTLFRRRDLDLIETERSGSFVARSIPDPSGDIVGVSDDQLLALRGETLALVAAPTTLTNPADHRPLTEGAELDFRFLGENVFAGLGGAAYRSNGRGAHTGFRVFENDPGLPGEAFDRANADSFGYGRLFFDRAYGLRLWLGAKDVKGFALGGVGRYDDGQPFARVVLVRDLPQGLDAVPAIPRGRARFHYALSVDLRAARTFRFGARDVEFALSAFNALGRAFEAEERVVWDANYRAITLTQPPRSYTFEIAVR